MTKLLTDESILSMEIPKGYELASNFNSETCVNKDTKIIIVGTITQPDGVKNGYFYTAPYNKIYGYIDAALNTHLKEKKEKLMSGAENKEAIIQEIKNELITHNIAFLDIMKHVIRKVGSSADNDIKYYSLDKEAFVNIPSDATIICNSRLAEEGFKDISEKKYIFISQRRGLKEDWIKAIKRK